MIAYELLSIVKAKAAEHGIDPAFVAAFVEVETGGRTFATRFEPAYRYVADAARWAALTGTSEATETTGQMTSWGPMQVMGGVARELGFKGLLPELSQPEVGIEYGLCQLKRLASNYDLLPAAGAAWTFSEPLAAAYNAGSPRTGVDGDWINAGYVQRVKTAFEGFQGKL